MQQPAAQTTQFVSMQLQACCGIRGTLTLPLASTFEKIRFPKRLPPSGSRLLNLRDSNRDFLAFPDGAGAPQRQCFPGEGLRRIGLAGVICCRRFQVQPTANFAVECIFSDRKHLL